MLALCITGLWLVGTVPTFTGPPVLTDPQGAVAAVLAGSEVPEGQGSEILLLAGLTEPARDRLPLHSEAPRIQRLIADIWVAEGRATEAHAALDALQLHPGWKKHARHQRHNLQRRGWQRRGSRMGLVMFAMCLAVVALGGARELLRLHLETLATAAACALTVGLTYGVSPQLGLLVALVGIGTVLLNHGAVATLRRTHAGTRARVLLAVLVILGVSGVIAGLGFQLGVGGLIQVLVQRG